LNRSTGTWSLLIIGILGISTSTLWIRLATDQAGMEEVQLAFLRLALALPVLWLLSFREKPTPPGQCASSILLAGGCLALHFGAWMASLAYLSVATSVVLVYLHPVIIYAIEVTRGRAQLKATRVGGVLLTLTGTTVLAWFAEESGQPAIGDQKLWGMALSMIGSLAFVGYLLAGRTATEQMPTITYATRAYAVAAIGLLVWLGTMGSTVIPQSPMGWMFAGLLALFPTLLGHTPLNAALKRLPPTVVSTTYLGEMAGAPLLVWLVIQEAPPTSFWIGGPLVVAGIMAVAWKSESNAEQTGQGQVDSQ
jgi:drug/metabolite transporter (DMT)-like permease